MIDILSDEELLEESDDKNDTDFASEKNSSDSDSLDRFLLKINRSNGLYIFGEYIKPLSFKFCFSYLPIYCGMTFLFYFILTSPPLLKPFFLIVRNLKIIPRKTSK